jgi:hypothetical protein
MTRVYRDINERLRKNGIWISGGLIGDEPQSPLATTARRNREREARRKAAAK